MNKIQKGKGALIGLGIALIVCGLLFVSFGVVMLFGGIGSVAANGASVSGILKIVFGAIFLLLFFPSVGFGIKFTWVGTALTATTGSVKQGNIAKDGGTVNMVKCDKCGTERKDGETVCSECGKTFEDKK